MLWKGHMLFMTKPSLLEGKSEIINNVSFTHLVLLILKHIQSFLNVANDYQNVCLNSLPKNLYLKK
jgi:hypothetical protein